MRRRRRAGARGGPAAGVTALALLASLGRPAAGEPCAPAAVTAVAEFAAVAEVATAAPAGPAAPGGIGPEPDVSESGFASASPALAGPPAMGSRFRITSPLVDRGALLASRGMGERRAGPRGEPTGSPEQAAPGDSAVRRPGRPHRMGGLARGLSSERTRLMLQSLTVPGWGQATLDQRRAALGFGLAEIGVWASFTAFRIQQHLRRATYERTALLFAGIDLGGRDENFRRIVGFYLSSDEYNRLVVRRDAANLFFGDPGAQRAYYEAHKLQGADTWSWSSEQDLLRYRAERQATQRAIKRSQDALAAAVINRLLSVIHASRSTGRRASETVSWQVECVPAGRDPTAFRLALRADF